VTSSTYQVQVAGRLGPVLRSAFADLGMTTAPAVTVFRVRLEAGQGPAEIAAMVDRKGLVLLRARPVPTAGRRPAAG
jgi:hypothetical protein